jgi:peptide/nickel transport system ATP-binding protein
MTALTTKGTAAGDTTPETADEFGEILLDIRGLSVDYGLANPVHAVDGVDLRIHRGEVVGLAGESGSGKSTLAYAVTRLLRDPGVIVAGDAFYYDWPDNPERDLFDQSSGGLEQAVAASRKPRNPLRVVDLLSGDKDAIEAVRWSQIAVVFQSALHALNPVMRVGTLLDDVLKAHDKSLSARQRLTRSEELLDLVGISPDRLRSYPHQLSGGMRQRVMIALSLALQPRLLIMDEPTTALDVVIQREILDELMDLKERLGFSVLFITHDLSLLIEIADTIAVMYAGRLVEKAPAKALFNAPRHPYTYGLTRSFPSLHGEKRAMSGIEGSPPDLRLLPVGCPFRPRCAWSMDKCAEAMPPMIDVSDAAGRREVLCYLHDGQQQPPIQVSATALPDPTPRVSAPLWSAVRGGSTS